MSVEKLTGAKIFAAERKRATGNNAEAAQATRAAIEFPLETFPELDEYDKKLLLIARRINVVANNSMANRAWEAPTVAHYLGEAKKGIVTVYKDPKVQEAAKILKEDTKGNPYEFNTEMAGDELAYTMTLAALTGNTALLNPAIERMNLIIKKAKEPTAKTLAEFRKARLIHHANHTRETFKDLKQSYTDAAKASVYFNRPERVATIASRYTIDSITSGHPIEALKGVATYLKATLKDRSTAGIFRREVVNAVTESKRHRNWRRTTPPGVDYDHLSLP